eukprot:1921487-Rhodomonas_salina.2
MVTRVTAWSRGRGESTRGSLSLLPLRAARSESARENLRQHRRAREDAREEGWYPVAQVLQAPDTQENVTCVVTGGHKQRNLPPSLCVFAS